MEADGESRPVSAVDDQATAIPHTAVSNTHPLTAKQERKLVDYLEDQFLELTRNYKKRSQPSSTLQTLSSYLTVTHTLLSMILQIPPVDPSTSLRTSLLLRLTGEVLGSIPGYTPDVQEFPQLLDWLKDLDEGWVAVLRNQRWDPEARRGVDLALPDDGSVQSTPISQTERTRLRSLLIAGTDRLEEWLAQFDATSQDFELTLQNLGLQQGFDDLFSGTLREMGSLAGSVTINDPQGMVGTC